MSSFRKRLQTKFRKVKKEYLKEHPYCEICLLEGVETPATDVHHIVARWDPDKFLDPNNLVALCHLHHLMLHQEAGTIVERERVKKLLEIVIRRKNDKKRGEG